MLRNDHSSILPNRLAYDYVWQALCCDTNVRGNTSGPEAMRTTRVMYVRNARPELKVQDIDDTRKGSWF